MAELNLTRPIAFFDIESTGTNTQQDRIVEISVIKINPQGKEEFLSSIINPEIPIPQEAIEIHGITNEEVVGKPIFKDFAQELFEFLKDCDIGGFYMSKFDLPLLEKEFERVGIPYSRQGKSIIDVLTIYHKFNPRDLSSAYKEYCGKDLDGAHRSEADVRATIEVFKVQLEKHSELPNDVEGLHEFCNRKDPNWVDSDGKFIWSGGNVVFNFSQHKGKTLQEVAKSEIGFLNWIIAKDFSSEIKKICEDALNGVFPIKS